MRDVIVVGAGPGGTSVGKELAKLGYDVAVFEKRQEIGAPKRCGEGLSFSSVERLGLEIPKRCIRQEITGANIYPPNEEKFVIDLGKTAGYILERKQFDKWLAEEASGAGAKVQAKTNITDLILKDGKVAGVKGLFCGEEFEEEAKVVVAADGVESIIARKAGLKTFNNPKLIDSGFQYEMCNIELKTPHFLDFFFGSEIAPRGYIWIFPKGDDVANVGIGILGSHEKTAKYFLDKWLKNRPDLNKGSILEVNSGGIPVGGFLEQMSTDNFLAVGDSAHQVNPLHGGGMAEAITAGRIAAKVIHEALEKGDTSRKFLSRYDQIWWEERGRKLKNVEKVREVIEALDDDGLNFLGKELSGENIVELSKGKSLFILGKILMKKPRWIILAKKLL